MAILTYQHIGDSEVAFFANGSCYANIKYAADQRPETWIRLGKHIWRTVNALGAQTEQMLHEDVMSASK